MTTQLARTTAGASSDMKERSGYSSGHMIAITPTGSWIFIVAPYSVVSCTCMYEHAAINAHILLLAALSLLLQYNHFTALCPGLPRWASTRKKHSSTHIYPYQQLSFISFLHLLRSIASSLLNLCAWQSFCTTFSQVLFGLPLGLAPSTSYSIHTFTKSLSSFRNTCPYYRNLFWCSTEIMSSDPSLFLNSLLGTLTFMALSQLEHYILPVRCYVGMVLAVTSSLSVCLSQVGVLSKRLKRSSSFLASGFLWRILCCVGRQFGYLQKYEDFSQTLDLSGNFKCVIFWMHSHLGDQAITGTSLCMSLLIRIHKYNTRLKALCPGLPR